MAPSILWWGLAQLYPCRIQARGCSETTEERSALVGGASIAVPQVERRQWWKPVLDRCFTAAAPQSCHCSRCYLFREISTYICRNRYNLSDSRLDRVFLYQQHSHGSLRPWKLLAAVGRLARHRAVPPRVAILLQLAAAWLIGPRSVRREALRFVPVARLQSRIIHEGKGKREIGGERHRTL